MDNTSIHLKMVIQNFLLLLILYEGEVRELSHSGVPVQAQAVNLPTLVNAI
jgi:hypothetical protein